MRDVLQRMINGHPVNRLDGARAELLRWSRTAHSAVKT
jgi:hypothetical protein